jgi:Domain of unknown function (DUF5753)
LEAGAASIRNFEPVVVPGLLQTADYAREIFRNGPIELDPDGAERLVEVRLARQEILARDDRPRLWAVIDEAVIHRVVGRVSVMRGQLRHLADSAQQGKTTIQVVPYRAGAHAGTIGAFVILDLEEPADPAMVNVETLARGHLPRRVFGCEPLYRSYSPSRGESRLVGGPGRSWVAWSPAVVRRGPCGLSLDPPVK